MMDDVKCGAATSSGRICQREVPQGFTRCYMHGGAAPGSKEKAKMALALIRMPAIEALHTTLEQLSEHTCATCGFPKGDLKEKKVLVAVCRTILDRTELGPRATLEVRQSDGDLDLTLLSDDEKQRMIALLAQVRQLKSEIRRRLHATVFGAQPAQHATVQ